MSTLSVNLAFALQQIGGKERAHRCGHPRPQHPWHAGASTTVQRVRDGGAEIVKLLRQVRRSTRLRLRPSPRPKSYLKDKKRVLPCAAYLRGEYGVKGLYIGVPAVIGAKGMERVIEIDLNTHERLDFKRSVEAVQNLVEACVRIAPGLQQPSESGSQPPSPAASFFQLQSWPSPLR